MDAFSCTPAVRPAPLAVASLKGRHNSTSGSMKLGASSRNVSAPGGSVAETAPPLQSPSHLDFLSPLRPLWLDRRRKKNTDEKETEDSDISLLNGGWDVNFSESFEAVGDIQRDSIEECRIQGFEECAESGRSAESFQGQDSEEFSFRDHRQETDGDSDDYSAESSEEGKNKKEEDSDAESNADGKQGRSSGKDSDGGECERGNWIMRILEMRSFWRDKNNKFKSAAVMEPLEKEVSSSTKSGCSESVDCCCECYYSDDSSASLPLLEVPRTEVKHDRNSFSRFLHRVSLPEIKFFAQLSYLSNLAYTIPDIKPGDLLKNHRLRFITSSLEKKAEAATKAKELAANDRSSAISYGERHSHSSEANSKRRLPVSPAVAHEIAAAAASYLHSQTKHLLPFKSMHKNEHDVDEKVNNEIKQAAESVQNSQLLKSKADTSHKEVDPMSLNADSGCEYKLMLLNSSTQSDNASEISGLSKSEAASYLATSSMTAVVAAEEKTKQAVANDLQSIHSSPCEWFICDDESTHTRLFVIQGSESLASWQANLFFEPIKFEGLEAIVHRGIYEAAKGIYEQILPEVYAHLEKHGDDARIRFTGHSLGGSLSVLVNLMLLIRARVPLSSLLPVITFGSPCIMCGGDHLLKKLGLSTSHIQSIMMHRDIVPRAFSCHYPDQVAQILKRLNATFRNHPCLDNLGLLYAPMGQLLILQPDDKVSPPHHLLPSGSGLYILRHIMNNESDSEPSREVQVRAAQMAFLNSPHPLETLSDPGAYGSDGSILRDHDSRNYLRTLKHVLRQEVKCRRRLLREQRKQMWWPLVVAESSMRIQRSPKLCITMDRSKTFVGAVSTIDSITSTQPPSQFGFPLRVGIIYRRSKDTLSRFGRLIASQHMQMGVLFFLSARMLIAETCTNIYS